jgi:mono/diheme cytochrome c family protein
MTAKFLTAIALMVFVSTAWARLTDTNMDFHGVDLSNTSSPAATNALHANAAIINGRALFLKNCAHCHGATARGDDGPDLHNLDYSDDWIANRIRKGKAGEMTAFAGKLQPAEIAALVTYVKSLK